MPSRIPDNRRRVRSFLQTILAVTGVQQAIALPDRIERDLIYRDCDDRESEATEEVSMIGRMVLAAMKK